MIEVFTDGGARGNPGPAAYGFVVFINGKIQKEAGAYIGIATNNIAEYTAVVKALEYLSSSYKKEDLNFYLDSNLVVSQLSGLFKIKNAKLMDLVFKVRGLETAFGRVRYSHIPRGKNKEADRLVNLALDNQAKLK